MGDDIAALAQAEREAAILAGEQIHPSGRAQRKIDWTPDPRVEVFREERVAYVQVALVATLGQVFDTDLDTPVPEHILLRAAAMALRDEARRSGVRAAQARRWTKTCEQCDEEYEAKKQTQRFCSGRCRVAHHRAVQRG